MKKSELKDMHEIVLVLDSVRSKENVGALFRTADAAGVREVILCGITPQPLNRFGNKDGKVAKSALGAELSVPWKFVRESARAVAELKNKGWQIVALEQTSTSVDYTSVTWGKNKKIVLIVGNEVDGVSAEVLARADTVVHIPMYGSKESLNVTTATGIALYSFR